MIPVRDASRCQKHTAALPDSGSAAAALLEDQK